MKQRLYIDTSVFGGFFDEEFSEFTRPLIERFQKGEFNLLFSTVTQDELSTAPENIKGLVTSIKLEFQTHCKCSTNTWLQCYQY
jgi:predicted nucleic acid-binding protein